MNVDKNAPVPNSLALPSQANYVLKLKSKGDIVEADSISKKTGLPLLVIGEGTNIAPQNHMVAVIAISEQKGIQQMGDILRVQAGEKWDDVVRYAVDHDLSGVEALSSIPGKMGAAPIQNIGAYGTEVSEAIESIEVYEKNKKEFKIFKKSECQFGYRTSLFKKYRERFVIASVDLKLSNTKPKMPRYNDIEKYFAQKSNDAPTLKEIREAIIEIRKNKLPDPQIIPNAGSFFTNPVLEKSKISAVKNILPEIPVFPTGDKFKVPAGYLIEKAGLKGAKIGKLEVYKNNALVLTNPNHASFDDLIFAKKYIQRIILEKFGVSLEAEVNIIESQ